MPENPPSLLFGKRVATGESSSSSRFVFVSDGIYRDRSRKGIFYHRPTVNGRRTWRKLKSTAFYSARDEAATLRTDHARAKLGLARDPYRRTPDAVTVGELLAGYLAAGCPQSARGKPRSGAQLDFERRRVAKLKEWGAKLPVESITLEHCDRYHKWRIVRTRDGFDGDRSAEVELVTLSNAFRWAVRHQSQTGVRANPISQDRPHFCQAETIRHCRETMPASGDELHAIARYLFQARASQVLGWQTLLQAMIGQRTNELLRLRWDAPDETSAGFIRDGFLFLHRSTTTKGTYGHIELTGPLAECFAAFRAWHAANYPGSPWFFPSPVDPRRPVIDSALIVAMRRACEKLKLPLRTPHGLRSFFVNVLRSEGKPDSDIALRIGHKSGGDLIVRVYGEILPYKLSWLPKVGTPAWVEVPDLRPTKPVRLGIRTGLQPRKARKIAFVSA